MGNVRGHDRTLIGWRIQSQYLTSTKRICNPRRGRTASRGAPAVLSLKRSRFEAVESIVLPATRRFDQGDNDLLAGDTTFTIVCRNADQILSRNQWNVGRAPAQVLQRWTKNSNARSSRGQIRPRDTRNRTIINGRPAECE